MGAGTDGVPKLTNEVAEPVATPGSRSGIVRLYRESGKPWSQLKDGESPPFEDAAVSSSR
jgi:hypothetical protein